MTLSVNNLPAHSHSHRDTFWKELSSYADPRGFSNVPRDYNLGGLMGSAAPFDADNNASYYQDRTTADTGGGQAFDIRPPYYALAYIMRVQ